MYNPQFEATDYDENYCFQVSNYRAPVSKWRIENYMNFGTNFLIALTFTPTDVGYGANLFYYISGSGVNVTNYTTNSVVSLTPTNNVWAIGWDICQDYQPVTAAWNCSGPVTPPSPVLVISAPTINPDNGDFIYSLSFPTDIGESYTVLYKNALTDPSWSILSGPFAGTGGIMIVTDEIAPGYPSRYYRIMFTP
jgi:hypothetical protein